MDAGPPRYVLVYGTMWPNACKRRMARMIGATLARAELGLVVGRYMGIDRCVSESFAAERTARGGTAAPGIVQITGGGRFDPLTTALGFRGNVDRRIHADSFEAWKRSALSHSDAGVMVGGGRGALDLARRLIDEGRPVFPIPFSGGMTGNADLVFQDILRTWDSNPVPGISRTQYLRLAEPWISGTGALRNLLRGTLATVPDVFISYRRDDAPAAAGRVDKDLAEEFGRNRVFLDIRGIAPSSVWAATIHEALRHCKVGVVIIGRGWMSKGASGKPRLWDDADVVRSEIARLLSGGKVILPLLVEGATLPRDDELPQDLRPLLRYQAMGLDNPMWETTMRRVIGEIQRAIDRAEARGDAVTAARGSSAPA